MLSMPNKSQVHKRLEILKKRSILSGDQQKSLDRMSTGYSGELYLFKRLQSEIHCEPIQLYSLLLKVNSSECQIDCLLIFQNECILIEVKNYQGDFYIESNDWYTLSKDGIKNPLYQLQRTELLLKQFFKQHQIPLNIRSYVVFTHPEFQLYQAPLNIPIVFPTQLRRFICKFQNIPCQIQKRHHHTVKQLKSQHLLISSYETMPVYNYTHLRKGVTCGKCDDFMVMDGFNHMRCTACDDIDSLEKSTMRNIYDLHRLFPDKNITVQTVAEWTNHHVSKHRIRTILSRNCRCIRMGKYSYYILNKNEYEYGPRV